MDDFRYLRALFQLGHMTRLVYQFDTRLRKEIVEDFFIGLTLYVTNDNDPPSATAEETDYGIVTSLGYSF